MGTNNHRIVQVLSLLLSLMANNVIQAEQILIASVSFSEVEPQANEPVKPVIKPKTHWHELHGSLNREYVYLIVKKTGQRQIEGYLFDGRGNRRFVYGEWFNRELQVYDRSNKRLTVILNE